MRIVSLMTVSQEFSKLIREVERGEELVITRRGVPIARLLPHQGDRTVDPAWTAAYQRMMARLEKGASLGGLRVRRDELFDR